MTPNFALDLSEGGITLLHRAPDGTGWHAEGHVDFADDNVTEGLSALRARAIELEGDAFQTKLILPHSQLLFTTVSKDQNIAKALSERTPYRPDQLIYDSCVDGDVIRVVAVAQETLGEAEGFIAPHHLNPAGFTAIPEPGQFIGEPMLGAALTGNGSFEPDPLAVRIVEKSAPPVPPVAEPVEKAEVGPTATPEPKPEAPRMPDMSAAVFDGPQVEAPAAPAVVPPSTPPSPAPAAPAVAAPQNLDPIPRTHQAAPATGAFASRRAAPERAEPTIKPPVAKPVAAVETSVPTTAAPDAKPTVKHPDPTPTQPQKAANLNGSANPQSGNNAPKLGGVTHAKAPAPAPAAPKSSTPRQERATPALIRKPQAAPPKIAMANKGARSAPPAALAAELAKADPIAKLAAQEQRQRGKPRYLGLILTTILLVCLGLAAVISSYVLPDDALSGLFATQETETNVGLSNDQTEPALIEGIEAEISEPAETAEPTPLTPFEELEIAGLPPAIALQDPLASTRPPSLPETAAPPAPPRPELTEDGARAAYAATGIWQFADVLDAAATAPENLDALYVTTLDPRIAFEDAPALAIPGDNGGEVALAAFTPPPPAGVTFDFDARGLVRPTAEGAINPYGIPVFAGRPAVAAQPRPDAAGSPTPQFADSDTAANSERASATAALAAIRPAPRPSDIVETVERPSLGGRSRAELAALRPISRPVETARVQTEAIALALQEANEAATTNAEGIATATTLAVANSPRVAQRPDNIARIAAAAQRRTPAVDPAASAAIASARASTARPSQPPSTGPAVPRTSRVAPTGPVTNTVARAATDTNAISLGQVSLVGVFGTSNNRRALVRMPNGRFQKVSIGDRVDGGRVAAITSSTLRYVKGGRTVTIQMPQG